MKHDKRAVELFMKGHNCSQSTAAPFASEYGLDEAALLRAMAGFGAGLGGLRETCGAVSAMVYVAGLHAGGYTLDDKDAKKAFYDLVKRMVGEFSEQHGTICCRELLEKAGCVPRPDQSERTAEYYATRPCARLIASAAEILDRALGNS